MEKVKQLLQNFNNDLIIDIPSFGMFRNEKFRHEATRRLWYPHLTDDEFDSKMYKFIRCGAIAGHFINILRDRGYKARGVFLYSNHISRIENINGIDESTIIIKSNRLKDTHAVIEFENKKIIDPTVGLIYNVGLSSLLRGKGIDTSWNYLDQYKYFENYPHHRINFNLVYVTTKYWLSVVKSEHYPFEECIR